MLADPSEWSFYEATVWLAAFVVVDELGLNDPSSIVIGLFPFEVEVPIEPPLASGREFGPSNGRPAHVLDSNA